MRECSECRSCFADDVLHCPYDGMATAPTLVGDAILDGRYQLEKRLGQGGMGVVFKARHIFLKTQHAIKIILPDLVGNDPNLVTRFRQEAMAAAAIRHQNIIAVTDFGVVRGTMPFLVMEFAQGKSLQDLMGEEGAMGPVRAFELMQPICAGIAAAHRQNIVHRDLKPLNVMIQNGIPIAEGVKILDFGLAKIKSGELLGSFVAAQTTGLMGSPFYMAPEQWSDEQPDARADVYSLGVMFYQMLCGEVPFKGNSIPAIMKKHLTEEAPTFSSRGVEVPPQIEAVVRHTLEKEPEFRTSSADAFLDELREAMTAASAVLKRTGEGRTDPFKTVINAPVTMPPVGARTTSDPLAGTISGTSLADDAEKLRIAREELAREGEAKRQLAAAEAERKRKEEQERLEAEKQAEKEHEREAQRLREEEGRLQEERRLEEQHRREEERKRVEELVAHQTKAIEERLSQLAASIPPKTTVVVDPEATQVRPIGATTVTENSYPTLISGQPVVATPPKRSTVPFIVIGLIVIVLGGGVLGFWLLRPKTNQAVPNKPVPEDPGPENPNPPVAFKPEFIQIPAGSFQMGRNGATVAEVPVHAVTVKPFSIDKTEVTNAEYAQFVKETGHEAPSNWLGNRPIPGQELLP